MSDSEGNWYDLHTNVAALICHLADEHGRDFTARNAAEVVEKPWHWETEWAEYQVAHAAELAADAKRNGTARIHPSISGAK